MNIVINKAAQLSNSQMQTVYTVALVIAAMLLLDGALLLLLR